ncbi:MAG: CRTAC1 family protein [Planctomycetota bacterium]
MRITRWPLVLVVLAGTGLLIWLRGWPSPAPEPVPEPAPPASNAAELRRIGAELYVDDCPQYGRELRERLAAELAVPGHTRGERMEMLEQLASELLEVGEVPRAIELAQEALQLARQGNNPRRQRHVTRLLAQCWLREAENQNCLARHDRECCIFPPRAGALHTVREPAEKARELYRSILAEDEDNQTVRWLINVTTMLLGEQASDLPPVERIPGELFEPPQGAPIFIDVAAEAGVDTMNLAGGVALEDFDGDGWLDILTSTCDPLGALKYFHSRGDGTFEDRSDAAGTSEQLGGLNLLSADYDEDGDQDALILRGGWLLDYGRIPNSLLRNDGGEHFEDVTRAAGLADPAYPTQAATFGDFDSDGSLDLYIGNESRIEIADPGVGDYPSQLFMNDGAGVFTDRAPEAGVESDRYCKGVAAGDYDDDGDLDLYTSNIGFNRLYRNNGQARFHDVAAQAGVLEPSGRSFACWFFDQDEDGHLDLWVSGYQATLADLATDALGRTDTGARSCLYRNNADGTFTDLARKAGLDHPYLAMGANFADIDGDGWLDIYLGTGDPQIESLMPNVLLRNEGGRGFTDVTTRYGVGHLQKGHGVAFADFDHDGDQDLFHQLGGFIPVDKFQNVLFENRTPPGHHWLMLSLVGTTSNRDAVGARVDVHIASAEGPRILHRAPGAVSSFGGSPHRLEIGLGDAQRITRIEIRWPRTSEPQVFTGLPLDAWLEITEGQGSVVCRELSTFAFRSPG